MVVHVVEGSAATAKPSGGSVCWPGGGGARPGQEAWTSLYEGRGVGDRHGAIVGDGQQFICCHGEPVVVAMVTESAHRKVEEVQLPVCQTLPENISVPQRLQSWSGCRGRPVTRQNQHPTALTAPLKVCDVGVQRF